MSSLEALASELQSRLPQTTNEADTQKMIALADTYFTLLHKRWSRNSEEAETVEEELHNSHKNLLGHTKEVLKETRYEVQGIRTRGTWKLIIDAYDPIRQSEVVLQLFAPTKIAQVQAQEREQDELKYMINEAGDLRELENITTRNLEFTPSGKPFIVMKQYKLFFDKYMASKQAKYRQERMWRWGSHLASGFTLEEALRYGRQFTNAVREYHLTQKRKLDSGEDVTEYHGDMHAGNFAYDDITDKIKLSDMGSSTQASQLFEGGHVRKGNRGVFYIRDPHLFLPRGMPHRSSDVFSWASLMYKMFTGNYLFEEEIDEALKSGGLEEVEHLFEGLLDKKEKGLEKLLKKKLAIKVIPTQFKELMYRSILSQRKDAIRDGEELHEEFLKAKQKYEYEQERKLGWRRCKTSAKVWGPVVALSMVAMWTIFVDGTNKYYRGKANASTQYRIEHNIGMGAELTLEAERSYKQEPIAQGGISDNWENMLEQYQKKYHDQTVIDILVSHFYRALIDQKENSRLAQKLQFEAFEKFPELKEKLMAGQGEFIFPDIERYLLTDAIYQTRVGGVFVGGGRVDLEDAMVRMLIGEDDLIMGCWKASGSTDFTKYSMWGNDEKRYPNIMAIVHRWMHYVTHDKRLQEQLEIDNKKYSEQPNINFFLKTPAIEKQKKEFRDPNTIGQWYLGSQ